MKFREKDTSSIVIRGTFKKVFFYGVEVYLRCNSVDLSVRLFEFDQTSFAVNVMIEVKCLEVDIDDTKLNIDIHAKCRYCDKKIGFCNNIFEIYYCSQHGFLLNQAYIMYFAKKRNNHDSNDIVIKNPNITNKGECPYKKKYGTCSHVNCAYAHSSLEIDLWKYLEDNEITMQLLACHQQKISKGNVIKVDNKNVFERTKVIHEIVNTGNVTTFKDFIKYSNDEILKEYNENSQSLLHVAVRNKNSDMIKLLLDGSELRKCFNSNELSNSRFYNFVNHKSNDGYTPFEWLLHNGYSLSYKILEHIFNLFFECDFCDIEEPIKICKHKELIDF
jgi:hypothetical protein